MPIALTPVLLDSLNGLIGYMDSHAGVAPSYNEIGDLWGMKGRGEVYARMSRLEERGWIRREPRKSRAITILHRPPVKEPRIQTIEELRTLPDEYLRILVYRCAQVGRERTL